MTFYREGKAQTVKVTIDELPSAPEVSTLLGFRVRSRSTAGGKSALEIDQVITDSPAFQAGLRPGMRIVVVGKAPVATLAEFESAARQFEPSRGLTVVVQTADGRISQRLVGGPPRNGP